LDLTIADDVLLREEPDEEEEEEEDEDDEEGDDDDGDGYSEWGWNIASDWQGASESQMPRYFTMLVLGMKSGVQDLPDL
jgi:hypothetical protein